MIDAHTARENTKRNTFTPEQVNEMLLHKILTKIEKDSCVGANWICVKPNEMDKTIVPRLNDLGFEVEFRNGPTLLDADVYYVKW